MTNSRSIRIVPTREGVVRVTAYPVTRLELATVETRREGSELLIRLAGTTDALPDGVPCDVTLAGFGSRETRVVAPLSVTGYEPGKANMDCSLELDVDLVASGIIGDVTVQMTVVPQFPGCAPATAHCEVRLVCGVELQGASDRLLVGQRITVTPRVDASLEAGRMRLRIREIDEDVVTVDEGEGQDAEIEPEILLEWEALSGDDLPRTWLAGCAGDPAPSAQLEQFDPEEEGDYELALDLALSFDDEKTWRAVPMSPARLRLARPSLTLFTAARSSAGVDVEIRLSGLAETLVVPVEVAVWVARGEAIHPLAAPMILDLVGGRFSGAVEAEALAGDDVVFATLAFPSGSQGHSVTPVASVVDYAEATFSPFGGGESPAAELKRTATAVASASYLQALGQLRSEDSARDFAVGALLGRIEYAYVKPNYVFRSRLIGACGPYKPVFQYQVEGELGWTNLDDHNTISKDGDWLIGKQWINPKGDPLLGKTIAVRAAPTTEDEPELRAVTQNLTIDLAE